MHAELQLLELCKQCKQSFLQLFPIMSNALSIVQAFLCFRERFLESSYNKVIYVIKSNAKFIRKKERRQKIHSNHR
jgi:hypothetical protein